MDVAVEDQHPLDDSSGLHLAGGHRRVVEHAESLAPVGAGMVRPAGEAGGPAVVDRGRGRVDRRPGAPQRPLDEFAAPRKPDPPDLVAGERARKHPPHVAAVVHPQDLVVGGGMGFDECQVRTGGRMGLEPSAEPPVLRRRKPVPLGKRQRIAVGGKEPHGSMTPLVMAPVPGRRWITAAWRPWTSFLPPGGSFRRRRGRRSARRSSPSPRGKASRGSAAAAPSRACCGSVPGS